MTNLSLYELIFNNLITNDNKIISANSPIIPTVRVSNLSLSLSLKLHYMNNENKNYIKDLIIRSMNGKATKSELDNFSKIILSLNTRELKKVIEITKEVAAEKIGELIEESQKHIPYQISEGDKEIAKGFCRAGVNFLFSICNEEVIRELITVYQNQATLTEEEIVRRIIGKLTTEINKVCSWKNTLTISNYNAVDRKVSKKMEKLFDIGKEVYFKAMMGRNNLSKEEALGLVTKFLDIIKSLTAQEVKVLKDKAIKLANILIDKYLSSYNEEIKNFAKSGLNLLDAMVDEQHLDDSLALTRITINKAEKYIGELIADKDVSEKRVINDFMNDSQFQKLARKNLINYTNYLNQLAGEKEIISFSEEEKSVAADNIVEQLKKEENASPESPQPVSNETPRNEIEKITRSFGNLIGNQLKANPSKVSNSSDNDFSPLDILQETEKELTKPAKPGMSGWLVGGLVGLAVVAGGLIVWLFMRKKKNNPSS